MPGYMRRSSSGTDPPERVLSLLQISGNARSRVDAGTGWDHRPQGPLRGEGCCRRWCGLSVLLQSHKCNKSELPVNLDGNVLTPGNPFSYQNVVDEDFDHGSVHVFKVSIPFD